MKWTVSPLILNSYSGKLDMARKHNPPLDDIPFNQMHSASRVDHSTDLSRLESKRRLLKFLLHVPVPEETP